MSRSFEGGEGIEDERVVGIEGEGVGDAGAVAVEAGAGELEIDVVAGGVLRGVGFHGGGPGGEDCGGGDVDEDGVFGGELGVGSDGVEEEGVDGVGRKGLQFFEAAVAGEAGGVADELADAGVVGVLIEGGGWGEEDARAALANDAGEGDGVGGADFEVGVAIEVEEFERCAEERGGGLGFFGALIGGAVGGGLAVGADEEVCGAAGAGFLGDDGAAAELDVVGGASWARRRGCRRIQGMSV